MGLAKIEVFRHIAGGDDARAVAANLAFQAGCERRVAAGQVAPMDGAAEAVLSLRAAGILVCFTPGFSPATRDGLLAALGWAHLADLVLSPADAGRGRPFPDMV